MNFTIDASVWVSAADPTDAFHAGSRSFLRAAALGSATLTQPSFAVTEVACALARRLRDPEKGRRLAHMLDSRLMVTERPVDADLLFEAEALGARLFLRAADALYAATAAQTGGILITWDDELLERASGMTPSAWLAQNA